MTTATTARTTADIKPGDVFSNSHRDFAECIIVTEVGDKGVMFEDYDGNEGFFAFYAFEDDDAEDGLWPSHWKRLATDHQQFNGNRQIKGGTFLAEIAGSQVDHHPHQRSALASD